MDPGSTALVSLAETVWVSVRSVSTNDSVPEVAPVAGRSPPGVLVPPSNSTVCGPVVKSGTSLVPLVIVIVNVWKAVSLLAAKLLSTRAI